MKISRIAPVLLCTVSLTGLGCTADSGAETSDEEPVAEVSSALSTAAFSGTVKDSAGVALAGASVVINGVVRTTDAAGKYSCSVVASASGYKVSIDKAGFAPATEFFSASRLNNVHALKAAYVQQINPTQSNTVVSNTGASLTIPANSLADANGVLATTPVNITIATHKPLDMPGDFTAVSAGGQEVALDSVGAISVGATLASSGAALRLKAGAAATAVIPVPPEVGAMPPCVSNNTCRLAAWRFNKVTGKWEERAASMKVSASATTITMTGTGGANGVPDNGGLGTWNADIEKTSPACTVVQLVGIPQDCYNPAGSPNEPGIVLTAKLPNAASTLITTTKRVTSSMPFVALYNIRENASQELGITFPQGAPPHCAGNLLIDSDPPPAASYPVLTGDGGATRVNSGAPWGGTGFPRKPGTTSYITDVDVDAGAHPCKSHVQFVSSADPVAAPRKAMTWSLLSSAKPDPANAYALAGTDAVTNAYQGDTWTNNSLPVLCINKNNPPNPGVGVLGSPTQTPGGAWRKTWSGGTVALTAPVKGTSLTSAATADALCASQLGAGYRMAEFHDGDPALWSGWDFWGAVKGANLSPFQGARFWVSINDQNANPW